ncbi:MAG: DNA primase [Pseudomarimonas sp.]
MAGRIPDAFIDDLLARSDIVELIGARVPLKRQGREYSGRCPFHDERSPSFTVSPVKQFYHCFGCGAHGSAIKFLMEYDRLEFLDAVEELAKRVGVEVPRETRQHHQQGDLSELVSTCEAAAGFFRQQLSITPKARDYLDRRGVEDSVRERFAIGYAPDGWDALKLALGNDARRLDLLERTGLLSKSDNGRVYDKFRDRIIFPIHDRRGRVIAFGGRVLGKDDTPKYLNSPETPLFHKGRELYGLWQVRQAHSKIPHIVVVEGYMDVVALFQYGVTTAVATLGTATTPDHAELLFRNAADVFFCFDGDRAGRGAAWKALESVLPRMKDGRQAHFLFLPDTEDPDSIVRKEGAAGFEQRLQAATPLSEFLFAELSRDVNLHGLEGKARLAERAKPLLEVIPDGAFRDLMQQRLIELTGVDRGAPARSVEAPRSSPRAPATVRRSVVRAIISLLLHKPELALALQPPWTFGELRQPGIPLLIELLDLCRNRPNLNGASLLMHFEGRDEAVALNKLVLSEFPAAESGWQAEFLDAIAQLERQTRAQRLADLMALKGERGLQPAERGELMALLAERGREPG